MESPLDEVRELLPMLSSTQKLLLISELARDLIIHPPEKRPHQSVLGALADLGPGPSEEDFDEARRAMFEGVSRVEVAR
jgi:hypothetical protein